MLTTPAPVPQEVALTDAERTAYNLNQKSQEVINWQIKDLQHQYNDLVNQLGKLHEESETLVTQYAKAHNVDQTEFRFDSTITRFVPLPQKESK